jgi:hypothetical protein
VVLSPKSKKSGQIQVYLVIPLLAPLAFRLRVQKMSPFKGGLNVAFFLYRTHVKVEKSGSTGRRHDLVWYQAEYRIGGLSTCFHAGQAVRRTA